MNTRSLQDAIMLGRAEHKHGLICFGEDAGWCQRVHTSVTEAHACRAAAQDTDQRTFSLDSVAADVIDDPEQRTQDVIAYLNFRDEQQTEELPVIGTC